VSVLIDGLAVARIARLIARDSLAAPLRLRLAEAVADGRIPESALRLASCEWCVAVWAAGGAALAARFAPRSWRILARMLAVSELAGLASELS
jgi:hypothetical protein